MLVSPRVPQRKLRPKPRGRRHTVSLLAFVLLASSLWLRSANRSAQWRRSPRDTVPPDSAVWSSEGACAFFPGIPAPPRGVYHPEPGTPTVFAATFRPKEFMEEGAGRPFLPLYQKQLERRKQRLLKVRFVAYSFPETPSCRPVYYHIHKNGGSTMNIKGDPSVSAFYTPLEQQLGPEEFRRQALGVLEMVDRHQKAGEPAMPLFTFSRDPVARFLSGVGQALKLHKLRPCNNRNKENTTGLLDCVLDRIHQTESFLDEHLEPQVFELYHGTMGFDLAVRVLDVAAIGDVLATVARKNSSEVSRRRSRGLVQGFNLSTAILTDTMIDRICSAYRVDLLFLRETGVSSSLCPNI